MRLILKLALLTGQRSSTVAGARVEELELGVANPMWRISRTRMKNRRAGHVLPLTPAVVSLFKEATSINGDSAFVFPSEGRGDHIDKHSVSRAMNRLCERIGIVDLHVHDFRKAINTWLSERLVPFEVRTRIMHRRGT
jgi:integrase